MSTNSNPLAGVLLPLAAAAVLLAAAAAYAYAHVRCQAQWARSGLHTEFGIFQGCLVRLPDGRWIPAETLRESDLPSTKQKVLLRT